MTKAADALIPLGVHFGLAEDAYHADPAIGSTDIRSLRRGAKLQIETKATTVGTAMHVCVLEGARKFAKLYMRRPDDVEGATQSDKGAVTKAANAAAAKVGRISLHGKEYDLIQTVSQVIDRHPQLAGALDGAVTEVSVFWERDGIRMKCRLDALKPRGIGDLKSIANEKQDKLSTACKWTIKRRRYDIQAEHYMEGRDTLPVLVKAGRIFHHDQPNAGEVERRNALLAQCAAAGKSHAFQFIFMPKDGTPTVWSCKLSRQNPMLGFARTHIEQALAIYVKNREAFTERSDWAIIEPVEELMIDEMPGGEFGWD